MLYPSTGTLLSNDVIFCLLPGIAIPILLDSCWLEQSQGIDWVVLYGENLAKFAYK